jgi:phage terminase large subunit
MRYKSAYGGRGSAKSHFFAEQVIIKARFEVKRIVCIREVQNSIKDSVKLLLEDKVQKLGYQGHFTILDNEIRGSNGSVIIFRGMQSYNSDNIKSLESFDIAWVEEAQTLTQHSLDLLRPTLRKQGSEMWFSYNPRYKTDAVDKFFRKNPPDNAISVYVNWHDNPWFHETELYIDMVNDYKTDPDKADHVWGGAYGSSQGAILARWVNDAEREGRVNNHVNYDPEGAPIIISSDIGYRDTAAWWYWQPVIGGYNLLKYDGDTHQDAEDWIPRINENLAKMGCNPDKLGKVWLPVDAKAKTFRSKHTSVELFWQAFGGDKVAITPPSRKADQIEAARTVIRTCAFNATECEDGLDGLRGWEFDYNEDNNIFSREPLHSWASHPSDSFSYGCQVMKMAEPAKHVLPVEQQLIKNSVNNINMKQITMNHLKAKRAERMGL